MMIKVLLVDKPTIAQQDLRALLEAEIGLVSQMPRLHLVLLPASRLFSTLESWLAVQRQAGVVLGRPGSLTALTGISRSRDIELHPSIGIHGPRKRHVIIVQGI